MVNNNSKTGFSLAEALISMMILSIFFAVAARMVTQKPKQEFIMSPHGYYECYYDNDKLYSSSTQEDKHEVTECTFTPAKNASVYNFVAKFSNDDIYYRVLYEMNYKIKISIESSSKMKLSTVDNVSTTETIELKDAAVADSLIHKLYMIASNFIQNKNDSGCKSYYQYGAAVAGTNIHYCLFTNPNDPECFCVLNPTAPSCKRDEGSQGESQNENNTSNFCKLFPNSPMCKDNNPSGDEQSGGSSGGGSQDGGSSGGGSQDGGSSGGGSQDGGSNVSDGITSNNHRGLKNTTSKIGSYEPISFENFQTEVQLVSPRAKIYEANGPGVYISW